MWVWGLWEPVALFIVVLTIKESPLPGAADGAGPTGVVPVLGRPPGGVPDGRQGHQEGAMEGYDKYAFEPFAVTVDLAVFTVRPGVLQVLLIERGQEPYAGRWALPGGFVLPKESAGTAARRELAEETGLSDVSGLHLEQLRTYSEPDRDPRMRVVSVAYTALLPDPPEPRGGGDAASARWLPYDGLGQLAFDHDRILADAHERVGAKLEYSCLATAFCPTEFTLGELRTGLRDRVGDRARPAELPAQGPGHARIRRADPRCGPTDRGPGEARRAVSRGRRHRIAPTAAATAFGIRAVAAIGGIRITVTRAPSPSSSSEGRSS